MANIHFTDDMQLGRRVAIPSSPSEAVIDVVPAPRDVNELSDYPVMFVRFACPEFTSLCPVTGQPDFAHIVIDYLPKVHLIESKALKLFLASYRNHAGFHEDCTDQIGTRLFQVCQPIWMRVSAFWYPRGGIPIDVVWTNGRLLDGARPPIVRVPDYRGR